MKFETIFKEMDLHICGAHPEFAQESEPQLPTSLGGLVFIVTNHHLEILLDLDLVAPPTQLRFGGLQLSKFAPS